MSGAAAERVGDGGGPISAAVDTGRSCRPGAVVRQHLSWSTAKDHLERRMGPIERLLEWMTVPTVETTAHRCVECSEVVAAAATECPDCGGDVERVLREPVELYWPHY